MKQNGILSSFFLGWALLIAALPAAAEEFRVFFGSYDAGSAERGIYTSVLNERSETLSKPERAAEVSNPGFLIFTPDFQFLYAVCGEKYDSLAAFSVSDLNQTAKSPKLTELNSLSGFGKSVCHLALDPSVKNILTANYSSSDFTLFSLNEDHSLKAETQRQELEGKGPNEKRQEKAHPHSVKFGAGNRFYVPDLGTDRIMIYELDSAKSDFTPNDPPFAQCEAGSGPRHLCFLPDKKTVYSANELGSTVTGFHVRKNGALEAFQTISTLPPDSKSETPNYPAEIACTPDGKFLYVSNRGHESIACFKVTMDGSLILREVVPVHGKNPRHFAVSPTGNFLIAANQDSKNVTLFKIHPETGKLTFLSEQTLPVSPVCVLFGPISRKDAEFQLESLKNLKPEPVSPNWNLKGDFPWKATMKRLPKIKPSHFPEELILARLTVETLDELQNFIQMGFEMEKRSEEGENQDFVREIILHAVIQHAVFLSNRFGSLTPEQQIQLKSIPEKILENLEKALLWSPQEPTLNLCNAWMTHYVNPGEESEKSQNVVITDPKAREFLDRGIEYALKIGEDYAYPELLAKSLMARAITFVDSAPEKAVADLEKAAEVNPKLNEQVQDTKLLLYIHAKKYDEALKLLDGQIEELKNLDVNVPRASADEEDEEDEESVNESSEAENSQDAPNADSEETPGSAAWVKKREEEKAAAIFKLQGFRVELLSEQKRWDDVLKETEPLLKAAPENEALLRLRLQALVSKGRFEDGIKILDQLLERNSLDANLYILRGQLFLEVKNLEKALEDFSEALSVNGFTRQAWDLKIATLLELDRFDEALSTIDARLKEKPEDAELIIQKALVFIQKKDYETSLKMGLEAEKAVEKALSSISKDDEKKKKELTETQKFVIQFIANWYLMAGKHPEAKAYYEKFMKLDDSDVLILNNLAWLLATSPDDSVRDGKRAVELAQKAVNTSPTPTNISTLAAAYAEVGDFEKALKTIDEGIKKAEGDSGTRESLLTEKANYEAKKPTREREEKYK
ncbi:MAG: beta-propeller fold lactonase family protein [Thermoguttaceae bacterium]|nr:beta-propeller fold lactonase family protein [Thermoguttaceae bacterium]